MIPKQMNPQTDFTAGQLNADLKRSAEKIVKSGARQMSNLRILNGGRVQQRPGRTAQFTQTETGRVDEIRMAPGVVYRFCFNGDSTLTIRNSLGIAVANLTASLIVGSAQSWTAATVDQIVWTQINRDVVICFPGTRMIVARWNGVTSWTFLPFAFDQFGASHLQAPFYRFPETRGITMQLSGITGSVQINFSSPVMLNATWAGAFFRYGDRVIQITFVASPVLGQATVIDLIRPSQMLFMATSVQAFNIGDVVIGSQTATQGEVTSVNVAAQSVSVTALTGYAGFFAGELLSGPGGNVQISSIAPTTPGPVLTWDEVAVSDARGWPRSCSTDQNRLILCDLPGAPELILWSSLGQPYNFSIGSSGSSAIGEVISGKPRVYHVIGGLQEVVFTDRGVYYVPISETNPLKPGSVVFREITPDAASKVRPVKTNEGYLYLNAGLNRLIGVLPRGDINSTKPYITRDVSENSYTLFKNAKCLAASTGDGTFPERYCYVLNSDGSAVVGRYDAVNDWYGFTPWSGVGSSNWISAIGPNVMFTTTYIANGTPTTVAELLDDTRYLDGSVLINAVPASIAPPGGKGPMWWQAGGQCHLIDGIRTLGLHSIDANGFIVPIDGEDLSSATLIAGHKWDATLEPFVPLAAGGQDVQQRLRRRRVSWIAASVQNSTGFKFISLYSGEVTSRSPAPGTIMQQRRVSAYNMDDNPTIEPPLREVTEEWRPTGRTFDPRVGIAKDTPGPLKVLEIGMEVTV